MIAHRGVFCSETPDSKEHVVYPQGKLRCNQITTGHEFVYNNGLQHKQTKRMSHDTIDEALLLGGI